MTYVDTTYYRDMFGGELINEEELTRLLRAASDVIDMVVYHPIDTVTDNVKKAVCYEAEMLYIQGGADALAGLSVSGNGISQQLGDYKVTRGSGYAQMINSEKHPLFVNGIPISPVAVELLRRDGLMSRIVK